MTIGVSNEESGGSGFLLCEYRTQGASQKPLYKLSDIVFWASARVLQSCGLARAAAIAGATLLPLGRMPCVACADLGQTGQCCTEDCEGAPCVEQHAKRCKDVS